MEKPKLPKQAIVHIRAAKKRAEAEALLHQLQLRELALPKEHPAHQMYRENIHQLIHVLPLLEKQLEIATQKVSEYMMQSIIFLN